MVLFSGKQRERDLETAANVSYNDRNKMIRRKATLTFNNFPRTTLLNTFKKKSQDLRNFITSQLCETVQQQQPLQQSPKGQVSPYPAVL